MRKIRLVCLMAACVACLSVGPGCATAEKRPNFIVVLADDQGFGQLPVYSDAYPDEMLLLCKNTKRYKCDEQTALAAAKASMPHLQKMAQGGVTFMNAYVTSPVCGPSRAGLMTARYQQRFGIYDNCDLKKSGVPLSETMLPALLQKEGYRTAMIGKWHLAQTTRKALPVQTHDYHKNATVGCVPEQNPINLGFDHYFGFNSSGTTYYDSPSLFRGLEQVAAKGYVTDEFTDEAISFIEASGDDPFFVYLAYSAPHIPLEAPAPDKYRRFDTGNPEVDNYYAYLAAIDDGLGKIVSLLKERGELENTLIVYLSDNGAVIDSPQPMNGPFLGNKGHFHQGGTHIPMVASWPDGLTGGKKVEATVSALDVMPTMLAAAGIKLPENIDGVDLRPHIAAGTPSHDALYWAGPEIDHWSERNKPFWRDYWEYVTERSDEAPVTLVKAGNASWAVLKGRWLLRCNEVTGTTELFDVQSDAGEQLEVSTHHPEVIEEMRGDYKQWSAHLGKPLIWSEEEYRRLQE